jgi:hypothetical protein
MKKHETGWLIRARIVLCTIYLGSFVLFEVYSAAATALDHSSRFSVWEAKLGWCLFVLPCLLVTGLIFLLRGIRETVGFYLAGLSALLYLAFLFLENAVSSAHMEPGDWLLAGLWILLCTIATAAAWLLKRPLLPVPSSDPQPGS